MGGFKVDRSSKCVALVAGLLLAQTGLSAPLVSAAPTVAPAPPFTACPAVGVSPSCRILVVVNPDRTLSVYQDPSVGTYDNDDDTLVGILNASATPVESVILLSPGSRLGQLDGDGLCTFSVPGCPFGPTGYEGPNTRIITNPALLDAAEIVFIGGLAPSATAYFSLEGTLSAAQLTASHGRVQVSPNDSICVPVTNSPGVFAIANSTITEPIADGYANVHQSGADFRATSTNNFTVGESSPNLTITQIGADGRICVTPAVAAHLILDLVGFISASVVTPAQAVGADRVLDTRRVSGPTAGQRVSGDQTVCVTVGHAGEYAIANSTITEPIADGYANVHQSGADFRTTSTNNFSAGESSPNLTITQIGADGRICVTPAVATHMILDLAGYINASAVTPAQTVGADRILDTRRVSGPTAGQRVSGDQTVCVTVGHAGEYAIANSTITEPIADGYANVHQSGADFRATSTNNFTVGESSPNLTITQIGADGRLCVTPAVATHLILDLVGFISASVVAPVQTVGADRILDTRR